MTSVVVVDYDCGNLFSVQRGLEHSGATVAFTESATGVRDADRLVLPGVGAFGGAATKLRQQGLFEPLIEYAASGRPLLGICIGMQLMFDTSEEFGRHGGLGLISGTVKAIPNTTREGRPHKIPHIGWNAIVPTEGEKAWDGTILDGLGPSTYCYFVHSFMGNVLDQNDCLSDCSYGGHRIPAVVRRGSVWGCQFHPEKSGPLGLKILANFLRQ